MNVQPGSRVGPYDYKLMVVDVQLEPEFSASAPRVLLDPGFRQILGMQHALSRDGSRLLVNRPIDQPAVMPLTLVQNWTEARGK